MPASLEVTLPVDSDLPRAAHGHLSRFSESFGLRAEVTFAADTAMEELLQNTVDHSGAHELRLRLTLHRDFLRVEMSDDGRAFNPMDYPVPDVNLPLEERPVGGLGLFMARKLMDSMQYEREGGRNYITLTKRLA